MVVLLLGKYHGHEYDLIAEEIRQKGGDVRIIDLDDWPSGKPFTQNVAEETLRIDDETIPLETVEGVHVRPFSLFLPVVEEKLNNCVSGADNPYATLTQLREYRALLKSVLRSLDRRGTTITPGLGAVDWEEVTPYASDLFDSLEIDTPETLSTVDSAAAKRFLDRHGTVVYKPVGGFGSASLMHDDESDQLNDLTTPVVFQEFVPGDDLRAYIVDGGYEGAFEYVVDDETFSFKEASEQPDAEHVELPESVKADILRAFEASPMTYSGIDLRRRDDGSYSLLEVNPGGRFMLPDSTGVTNVSGALAEYLLD